MPKPAKIKILILALLAVFLPIVGLFADTVDDLKIKITERQNAIKRLEEEIAKTEAQITASRNSQKTLSDVIKIYDAERRKFLAEINVTNEKISAKKMEITSLGYDIDEKKESIRKSQLGIGKNIRDMSELESRSTISIILGYSKLSDIWGNVYNSAVIVDTLNNHIEDLNVLKSDLEHDKKDAETKKKELEYLNGELSARKKIAESAKADQEKLLKETKNKESEYQKLLKQQQATKEAFEKELLAFESQLNFEVDQGRLPQTGSGVLNWPLTKIRITQYFGKTDFADSRPMLYGGTGHNGIDLAASIGTPVLSALGGVVKGTGDTDKACPGASYGKWILVEHANGLSTLYAHLSALRVGSGSLVETGEVLGYSGKTGYSTGPHLHFTVYATQGVRIMSRKSTACNGTYVMPVADLKAYLNPLSYL